MPELIAQNDKRLEPYRDILALAPPHPIIEDEDGILRWSGNRLIRWLPGGERGLDLGKMAAAYAAGAFSLSEYMAFYQGLGYSLCGFEEIFGERSED